MLNYDSGSQYIWLFALATELFFFPLLSAVDRNLVIIPCGWNKVTESIFYLLNCRVKRCLKKFIRTIQMAATQTLLEIICLKWGHVLQLLALKAQEIIKTCSDQHFCLGQKTQRLKIQQSGACWSWTAITDKCQMCHKRHVDRLGMKKGGASWRMTCWRYLRPSFLQVAPCGPLKKIKKQEKICV